MADVDLQKQQIEIAQRLQLKWLECMEAMLDEGRATSTDLATLARVLMQNGWVLDPSALPEGLRDKLMPLPDVDLDADVTDIRSKMA